MKLHFYATHLFPLFRYYMVGALLTRCAASLRLEKRASVALIHPHWSIGTGPQAADCILVYIILFEG